MLCRGLDVNAVYNDDGTVAQHGWFKATFNTLNATAAADFVCELFDGKRIAAPYPEDRQVHHITHPMGPHLGPQMTNWTAPEP